MGFTERRHADFKGSDIHHAGINRPGGGEDGSPKGVARLLVRAVE